MSFAEFSKTNINTFLFVAEFCPLFIDFVGDFVAVSEVLVTIKIQQKQI